MEMERAPICKGRFIPGPGHFVVSDVTWESCRYFTERPREVVLETKPGSYTRNEYKNSMQSESERNHRICLVHRTPANSPLPRAGLAT